jgi:hypothetical protein
VPNNFSEMRDILLERHPRSARARLASPIDRHGYFGLGLNAAALAGHRDPGVHTQLISDGLMELVDQGVVNGVAKQLSRIRTVGTFALGTRWLYDFLDEDTAFEQGGRRVGCRRAARRLACASRPPPSSP